MARMHQGITILFTDIVGFTEMSQSCAPVEVMHFLHNLFTAFDDFIEMDSHLWKVETIGDAFMVASGLFRPTLPGDVSCSNDDSDTLRSDTMSERYVKATCENMSTISERESTFPEESSQRIVSFQKIKYLRVVPRNKHSSARAAIFFGKVSPYLPLSPLPSFSSIHRLTLSSHHLRRPFGKRSATSCPMARSARSGWARTPETFAPEWWGAACLGTACLGTR